MLWNNVTVCYICTKTDSEKTNITVIHLKLILDMIENTWYYLLTRIFVLRFIQKDGYNVYKKIISPTFNIGW